MTELDEKIFQVIIDAVETVEVGYFETWQDEHGKKYLREHFIISQYRKVAEDKLTRIFDIQNSIKRLWEQGLLSRTIDGSYTPNDPVEIVREKKRRECKQKGSGKIP